MTKALRLAIGLGTALATVAAVGCDRTDSTSATPENTGTGMTGVGSGENVTGPTFTTDGHHGAGGAPTFGEPTGTGFPTGDARHNSGGGSGLAGFHGTGATGTQGTVTDTHPTETPKSTTQPVLQEPS